jgi:putative transposase
MTQQTDRTIATSRRRYLKGWCHGKLRLSGVGEMTGRCVARTPGRVVCCDIQRKVDGWYLSLVVECEPHCESGDREAGLDWGVETFATLAYGPGEYAEEENDRPLAAEQEALTSESRDLSQVGNRPWLAQASLKPSIRAA